MHSRTVMHALAVTDIPISHGCRLSFELRIKYFTAQLHSSYHAHAPPILERIILELSQTYLTQTCSFRQAEQLELLAEKCDIYREYVIKQSFRSIILIKMFQLATATKVNIGFRWLSLHN